MKYKKRDLWKPFFLLFLIVGTVIILRQQQHLPYQRHEGMIFGTVYHITYQSDEDLKKEILATLNEVDATLSTFNETSVVSLVNKNMEVTLTPMFLHLFQLAQKISADTDGAFDITVAPLVNAWGFGFKHNSFPSETQVDSLMHLTDYRKVEIISQGPRSVIKKANDGMMLDFSAIAKGYGCDRVAEMLQQHGVKNLMVEIGGEIVVHGSNPQGQPWRMGVSKPIEDSLNVNNEIESVITFNDGALATSGNYRNFYYRDGKKYAHTIDPKTGHPVEHNLLSATVIAPDCATADAYATAFMVMGMEKAKKILERHQELKVLFIYTDDKGAMKLWKSVNTNTLTHGTGR